MVEEKIVTINSKLSSLVKSIVLSTAIVILGSFLISVTIIIFFSKEGLSSFANLRYLIQILFFLTIQSLVAYLIYRYNIKKTIKFSNSISNPINKIIDSAESLATGDYNVEIEIDSNDEIGLLAGTLELMRETIRSYTNSLEEMIEDGKEELLDINNKLIENEKIAVENAHKAGMADIATGTLHNVGNILNSVKTSVSVLHDTLKTSEVLHLKKANSLLKEHIDKLDEFITSNPKGPKLMQYYLALEEPFDEEHNILKSHINRLLDKVNSIEEVISAQQSYAGASLAEEYNLKDIIEDALLMQSSSLDKFSITPIRNYSDISPILVQKNKLVHILINLFKNAKESMEESDINNRKLDISLEAGNNDIVAILKIKDSGKGISKENINKIFNHGFSTKINGHGFGLHSCANYMTEMGGKLKVTSEGLNKGACFILEFKKKD